MGLSATPELRDRIRPLLDPGAPGDALATYYALHHDPKRTRLAVHPPQGEAVEGFLVSAQTGFDLFRPLVTYRVRDEATAVALFAAGLPAGRPVWLSVPELQAAWALRHLQVQDLHRMRLYLLDRRRLARESPEINVLLQTGRAPDGSPRYEIRTRDRTAAVAGVNWRTPTFADVYVHTDSAARGRGWGRSVLLALATQLMNEAQQPLYVVDENNAASIGLAERVGFVDTGERELAGEAVRLEGDAAAP